MRLLFDKSTQPRGAQTKPKTELSAITPNACGVGHWLYILQTFSSFFYHSARFRSTPSRPFSAPLGLDDAESARARALEVSSSPETRGRRGDLESRKIESVSRVPRPARPSTEDYVKTHYLRQSDLRKVQSIPYISPIKNDVPLSINAQQG